MAATMLLSSCSSRTAAPSDKNIVEAEDEIYEAVVRYMVTPVKGQPQISQLVFDDALRTELQPGGDVESCKKRTRKNFSLEIALPVYNSLADKAYRFFTRRELDVALHSDTVRNFLERSCTPGSLSQTFHTDVPRRFVRAENVHFRGWPTQEDESKSFEKLYPGAGGIISFSHAGFDSTLDEAIVSADFVCGGLCGAGHRYILRKKSGRWEVVDGFMVWVS
jgi:hypothetical protein